jgi:DNA modification methylase
MIADRIKTFKRVKVADLIDNPKNWRKHPDAQRNALGGLLDSVGWADAVLARETPDGLMLIDGHLRKELADDSKVPVLVLDVTEAEADLILATHDPLTSMAETDQALLDELVQGLEIDNDETQKMLDELASDPVIDVVEDEVPELPEEPTTKTGDLFELGDHRLLCGDCTSADNVARLMDGAKASLLHADPPYGMGKENEGIANDNLYREKLDRFQMDWWEAWRPVIEDNGSAYIWGNAADLWRLWYVGGLNDSERLTMRNEITWNKGGGQGVGTDAGRMFYPAERCLFFMLGEQGFNNNADNYWEGWEPIRLWLLGERTKCGWDIPTMKKIAGHSDKSRDHWTGKSQWNFLTRETYEKFQEAAKGDAFKREYDDLKREYDDLKREYDDLKREYDDLKQEFYATRAFFDNAHDNMTDVWEFGRVTGEERHGHATPKPVEMVARAIKSSSTAGDVVAVPFGGTAPELIAAEQLDRKCYGMEISPAYCDVIIQRWENLTGKKAKKVK